MTERELRAYLLGEVSEDETGHLEARLLEDEDLFRTLESVEDDLFDDHARGRLSPAERERFEARYGTDGDGQRFARALAKRVDAAPGSLTFPGRNTWRRWTPVAAAAAIAIVAGGVVMMPRGSPVRTASPTVAQQPGLTAEARPVVFALALGTSRAPAEPATLTMSRDASAIQLRVRLNPADRFDTYTMELRTASTDSQVWQGAGLRAVDPAGDLILMATVPTADVADGSYDLAVRGVRGGAAPAAAEDLGFVSIKVVRVP